MTGVPGPQLAPPQGASLACMAGLMTYGRRQFEQLDATMRRLIPPFHAASARLTALVDADSQAFTACLVSARGQHGVRGKWGSTRREKSCVPLNVSRHPAGGQGLATAMPRVEGSTNKGDGGVQGARARGGERQTQRDPPEHRCLRGGGDTV